MRSYPNIESRRGRSGYHEYPYLGYAANGCQYYIRRCTAQKGWKAIIVGLDGKMGSAAIDATPSTIVAGTLAVMSAKLEAIGAAK